MTSRNVADINSAAVENRSVTVDSKASDCRQIENPVPSDRMDSLGDLATESLPILLPPDLGTAEGVTRLVHLLQSVGPNELLKAFESQSDLRTLDKIAALRRHVDVLEPLDSDNSMVATILMRIAGVAALTDLADHLRTMLHGPHLVAVVPVPDLPQDGLVQVLSNNASGEPAIAVDPAGRWLASLTDNGTIRIWKTATGVMRCVLSSPDKTENHRGQMLAVDQEGNWLAAAGSGASVEIWDPFTGNRIQALSDLDGRITALATDSKSAWLAASNSSGRVQVWSMPSGSPHVQTNLEGACALVIDPAGRWLAAGGSNKVRVWSMRTGDLVHEFDAPGWYVNALIVDPQGKWLCCAGDRATVRIWPIPGGEPVRNLTNRARVVGKEVRCLAVDPKGQWLATGGSEGAVRLWSAVAGTLEQVFLGHRRYGLDGIFALAAAADGTWLASAGADGAVSVWSISDGTQRSCLTGHTQDIKTLAADRSSRLLVSGSLDGTLRIWDPTARSKPKLDDRAGCHPITAFAADPAGSWYAFGRRRSGYITICDGHTGEQRVTAEFHDPDYQRPVTALQSDPYGRWLASAGQDGTVRIWDPRTGAEQYRLAGRGHNHYKEVSTGLVCAPNGQWLACFDSGTRIRIWSPITGERLNTLSNVNGVNDVVVDPSGTWLASAGADGVIRLWHPESSRPHQALTGHRGAVHSIAMDPFGTYLVSCGDDATIRIWDLEDGSESTLHLPKSVEHIAVGPRGSMFATADCDGTIRIWNPHQRSEQCVFSAHGAASAGLTFDPTGRYVASVAADATIRIWLSSTGASVASLRVGGALSCVNWTADRILVGGDHGAYVFALRDAGDI
ncbi:WD40 repeat domain-containing protein [Nocardia niigatensis]